MQRLCLRRDCAQGLEGAAGLPRLCATQAHLAMRRLYVSQTQLT